MEAVIFSYDGPPSPSRNRNDLEFDGLGGPSYKCSAKKITASEGRRDFEDTLLQGDGTVGFGRIALMTAYTEALLCTSSSAICTALVAAPLRKLSLTHQNAKPVSLDKSSRILPTKTSSLLVALIGMG